LTERKNSSAKLPSVDYILCGKWSKIGENDQKERFFLACLSSHNSLLRWPNFMKFGEGIQFRTGNIIIFGISMKKFFPRFFQKSVPTWFGNGIEICEKFLSFKKRW
jgi:hypothetical protein